MHQSTGRLPVCGCTITHGKHVKNKPSTSMTHVVCELKLYVQFRGHPCIHAQGNWVAIGCAVVYYAQAAHASTVLELNVGILVLHLRHKILDSFPHQVTPVALTGFSLMRGMMVVIMITIFLIYFGSLFVCK